MAEVILKAHSGFEVRSAGVAADPGSLASPQAVRVSAAHGLDLSQHRSSLIDQEAVDWADVILTMTRRHKAVVVDQFPQAEVKVHTLKEFSLNDSDMHELTQNLHQLYAQVDQKRREFNSKHSPTIAELQARRAELHAELEQLEASLAHLQSELREVIRPDRQAIAKLESFISSPDVADPFGQDDDIYRECFAELSDLINRAINRLKTSV